MSRVPMPPNPNRDIGTVLVVIGVVAGVLNMVLGTVLLPNAGGNKWLYAPVWGLPAFWAAGLMLAGVCTVCLIYLNLRTRGVEIVR